MSVKVSRTVVIAWSMEGAGTEQRAPHAFLILREGPRGISRGAACQAPRSRCQMRCPPGEGSWSFLSSL